MPGGGPMTASASEASTTATAAASMRSGSALTSLRPPWMTSTSSSPRARPLARVPNSSPSQKADPVKPEPAKPSTRTVASASRAKAVGQDGVGSRRPKPWA